MIDWKELAYFIKNVVDGFQYQGERRLIGEIAFRICERYQVEEDATKMCGLPGNS